jgi:plasmid stabilization system protein ParE
MSWERRGNRHYYYRKRRQDGRIISEYVGADDLAQAAAALDDLETQLRRRLRQKQQAGRALDAQVHEACDLIRALTYALLLATGHHTHKGQWRKKHHD